jgi:hypothetical protein
LRPDFGARQTTTSQLYTENFGKGEWDLFDFYFIAGQLDAKPLAKDKSVLV